MMTRLKIIPLWRTRPPRAPTSGSVQRPGARLRPWNFAGSAMLSRRLTIETEKCDGAGHHAVPADRPLHVHGAGRRSQGIRPVSRSLQAQVLSVLCLRSPVAQGGLQIPGAEVAAASRHSASELNAAVGWSAQRALAP